MIKTALIIFLGLFFVLNGISHLISTKVYEEYASKKGLISPKLMIHISGVALIFGGISLVSGFLLIYGIIGLSLFLVIAAFTIHQFWNERTAEMRLIEGMHFAKNVAILLELIYLGST